MTLTCFHCGEPLPNRPLQTVVLGQTQSFCCTGCHAVAEAIVSNGLETYYLDRTASSIKGDVPAALDTLKGYDHPDTQQQFLSREQDLACAELSLEGLSCAACAWLIEKRLRQEPSVKQATVNLSNHRLHLVWNDQHTALSQLLVALEHLGYHARPFRKDTHAEQLRRENRTLLMRLGVAGLGAMQVMMYAGSLYLGIDEADYRNFFRWICLIVTIPVFFYSGYPLYTSAWKALRARSLNMDVPVSIALISTFIISVYATIIEQGDIYFDSVSMFIFFLLAGRYLELRARQQAGETANDLTPILPQLAHRQASDGTLHEIPIQQLQINDLVLVKAGETLPCDGVVVEGRSSVSEALLTGEPLPLSKTVGDRVVGGSQNHDSSLVVRVSQLANASTLATLHQLLNRALADKPRLAQRADEISQWFVAAILGLALFVYIAWTFVRPEQALWATLAVLVATCPCALSLATPVALTAATQTLAKAGFLITRGHVLETLSRTTHVVFDKTGTLTAGQLTLAHVHTFSQQTRDQVLVLATALEQHSAHPLAKAFQALKIRDLPMVAHVINHTGSGISGEIEGQTYRLGHAQFALTTGSLPELPTPEHGQIRIWLTHQHTVLAAFDFQDRIRTEAKTVISQLQQAGLKPILLSGDPSDAPYQVAAQLGITEVAGSLSPTDKTSWVQNLQQQGAVVMMVGDGVNDAPVLATAHLAVAMHSGADLAQINADAVLLGDQLSALLVARRVAEKCQRIIQQNLYWAAGYNLAIVPPAALGLIPPWLAALGMSSSSLLVVLNALRLKRIPAGDHDGHHLSIDSTQSSALGSRDLGLNMGRKK